MDAALAVERRKRVLYAFSEISLRWNESKPRPIANLYFGRRDLENRRTQARGVLFAIVVDPCFDYLADVYLDDIARLRRATSLLRKAKPRSIAASDRDLPPCHQRHAGERRGVMPASVRGAAALFRAPYRPVRRSP